MPQRPPAFIEPRKSPVQARSTASVDAILQATIQVLLQVGKERLTTTRVAHRAGVSIGTLYQYFPNKTALLQAALKRHLAEVVAVVEHECREQQGKTARQMVTALITSFLNAKMRKVKTSVAFYSVAADIDGTKIAQQMQARIDHAIVGMLSTACDSPGADPQLIADTLQGAMTGVTRRLLEAGASEKQFEAMKHELIFLACAYLDASSTRATVHSAGN
ncbi:TetR/AcrR family transcriptional regulator [Paludibaculum fermentans]|uniref:TetR/AcrR family transcriptional regulator n=1 Tax=Paludibaculum fermentans TaxID=1473598 RepID=A0A7S7NN60_PALFE|nr:TetR/AcrR family transcriptional regulator [Paludibaculum fermentans]QOY86712.1 TetR/AcrR family transcriptional regulator [Paludibaculum fermentans]